MIGKFLLYIIVTILVIWSMDSVNIYYSIIFKKNKIMEARLFYFFLGISLIYLVTNFLWDLFTVGKIF